MHVEPDQLRHGATMVKGYILSVTLKIVYDKINLRNFTISRGIVQYDTSWQNVHH